MVKIFEIELNRYERDFKRFLKSRNVTLSKKDFKSLMSSETVKQGISLFDTQKFRESIRNNTDGDRKLKNNLDKVNRSTIK